MEAQLQSLIDTIKREAVEEAERQAQHVRSRAEEESRRTIAAAKQEADRIIKIAREESSRIQDAGTKALAQAGRNLILGVRSSITELFDRIVHREVRQSLSTQVIAVMLERIAQRWDHQQPAPLEAMLGPEDLDKLEHHFTEVLKTRLRQGVEFKPVETVDAGFFIGEKGRDTYYDFTDAGIARILSEYLNPRLSEILSGLQSRPADHP